MHRTTIIRLALALTGTACFAPGALAHGGPRNELPFTRHAPATQATATATSSALTDVRGEPKNEQPFTRRVTP